METPGEHGAADVETRDAPARNSLRRKYAAYPLAVLAALLLATLVRACLFHTYRIQSSSMEDTLLPGDYVLAGRFTYGAAISYPGSDSVLVRLPGLRAPKRGEIVIFRPTGADNTNRAGPEHIKRCVAEGGDTVEVRHYRLTVNGRPFSDVFRARYGGSSPPAYDPRLPANSRLRRGRLRRLDRYGPHVVPQDHIFLMGDNRANSRDSRVIGDVPLSSVRGRALFIYWSQAPDTSWLSGIRWGRIGRKLY